MWCVLGDDVWCGSCDLECGSCDAVKEDVS